MLQSNDPAKWPRARPLTLEQLRRAYQQPTFDRFFEKLAATRLKAMEHEDEQPTNEGRDNEGV